MVSYKRCSYCGIPRAILVKCAVCGKLACKDCIQIKDFICKDCMTEKHKAEYRGYDEKQKSEV